MDDMTEIKGLLKNIADILPTLATKDDVARLEGRQTALEGGQAKLEAGVAKLEARQAKLEVGQAKLEAGVAKLDAGYAQLRTDIAVLQSGQDEIRHAVAANHYRTMGRIDQLSDQFRRHLAEPHPLMAEHKPAAE